VSLRGASDGSPGAGRRRLAAVLAPVASMAIACALAFVGPAPARAQAAAPEIGFQCTSRQLAWRSLCPDGYLFFYAGESLVDQAWQERDFARLDALYAAWCTGAERFPDGRWKLMTYGNALEKAFGLWNRWVRDFERLGDWRRERPDSAAVSFAEATYWYAYAWRARGKGVIGSMDKADEDLYKDRLARAKAALDSAPATAEACPAPHALRLTLLTEEGAAEAELQAAFQRAVRAGKQYHSIWLAMARHHEPGRGGSAEAYERFAREAAAATRDFEGMGMYARLYGLVPRPRDMPASGGAAAAMPAWEALNAGYADLMQRYPSSIHNLGKYLGVACRSGDSALYRRLRRQIEGYEASADMAVPVLSCDRRHGYERPSKGS